MKWYLAVLKNYVGFRGRARRKEYWMFFLFNIIFAIVAVVLDNILSITIQGLGYGPIYIIYVLAILLPALAVSVRRLHDIGKGGGFIFINLIPLVGAIWYLVLMCTKGVVGINQYGDDPKVALGAATLTPAIAMEQQPAKPQGEKSAGNGTFKKTKSGDWKSFASNLCTDGMMGSPHPQLCLYLKKSSMAEMLVKFRPSTSDTFLSEPPEIMEFQDGTDGICFKVKDGRSIRKFLDVLLDGQDYPDRIVVSGGVTAQLPPSDKSYVLQQFGVKQGVEVGSVMIWG